MTSIYDINGNAITLGAGGIIVKRNGDELISEFLTLAQTYLNQTSFVYRDGQTIFDTSSSSNGIDCSTFVGLCMMGYQYSESPYATHVYINPSAWVANPNINWAIDLRKYKASKFADGSDPETVRYAAHIAHWMSDRGQAVPLSNGFIDVRPGDIVFYVRKNESTGEWVHPNWFMHINHIAIVLSKEDAPNTYVDGDGVTQTWDKEKYPYKHVLIDAGNTTPAVRTTHWLEEGQEDATNVYENNVNTVVMVCRFDLGALQPNS